MVLGIALAFCYTNVGCTSWHVVPLTRIDFEEAGLPSKTVRVETSSETILMIVERLDYPYLHGKRSQVSDDERKMGVIEKSIKVDLREINRLEVHDFSGWRTAGVVAASVAGGAVLVFGIVILISSIAVASPGLCPYVYVDRGHGFEFAGEAYPGAMYRSIQRSDLLPLPSLPEGQVSIRLLNGAPQTQYTDRCELLLVDHDSGVRAVSSFDAKVIVVGQAHQSGWVQDLDGRIATSLVLEEGDGRAWQSDLSQVAELSDPALREELEAVFQVTPEITRPVLELTVVNTQWLEVVLGRYFALMGKSLDDYLEEANDTASGPEIVRWREREGIDLRIEVANGDSWRRVATVPTVGAWSYRHVAVPLPVSDHGAGARDIRIRLSGGLGFWKVDHVALSNQEDTPTGQRIVPRQAFDNDGNGQLKTLSEVDGSYSRLDEINDYVELVFDTPPTERGRVHSVFLCTNGYYNVHEPPESRHSPGTLRTLRENVGSFARFSLDLYREYLRLARTVVETRAP